MVVARYVCAPLSLTLFTSMYSVCARVYFLFPFPFSSFFFNLSFVFIFCVFSVSHQSSVLVHSLSLSGLYLVLSPASTLVVQLFSLTNTHTCTQPRNCTSPPCLQGPCTSRTIVLPYRVPVWNITPFSWPRPCGFVINRSQSCYIQEENMHNQDLGKAHSSAVFSPMQE